MDPTEIIEIADNATSDPRAAHLAKGRLQLLCMENTLQEEREVGCIISVDRGLFLRGHQSSTESVCLRQGFAIHDRLALNSSPKLKNSKFVLPCPDSKFSLFKQKF